MINKLKILFYPVCVTVKVVPLITSLIIMIQIIISVLPSIQTIVLSNIINSLVNSKMQDNLVNIFIFIMIIIAINLVPLLISLLNIKMKRHIQKNLKLAYAEKISNLKYCYMEDKEKHNLIKRVSNLDESVTSSFYNIIYIFSYMFQIVFLSIIVLNYSIIAGVLIVFAMIALIYISYILGKKQYKKEVELTPYVRYNDYINDTLVSSKYAQERNLFQYSTKINETWFNNSKHLNKIKAIFNLKQFTSRKSCGLISIVFFFLIIFSLIFYGNNITIGIIVAIIQNILNLINLIINELSDTVNSISKDYSKNKELKEFFALEEDKNTIQKNLTFNYKFVKLEFKNVYFKYPNCADYILKNVSFTINRSKRYAFVGENGSGKSTIIKLILGFYDNYEGNILYNGYELKDLDKHLLYENISTIFQDFAKFNLNVCESITMSDKYDLVKYNHFLDSQNLSESYKFLYNDKLNIGKIFDDGISDLSGGQWQKIALLRMLFRDTNLKILDEPSAAMDPSNEKMFYEEFIKANKDKTVILISHRMAATKNSDVIFFLMGGSIVEEGDFEYLMKKRGHYQYFYDLQKEWYNK